MEIYMQMSRRSGSAAAPRSPFLPLNFFFFFLLFSSFFPLIIIFICCCWILLFSLSHNTWNVSARSIRRTWIVLIEFFFVGIGSQSRKAFDLQMFPLAQLPAKDSLGLAGILFPRLVAPPPPPKADWYWEINLINDGFELMEPEVYHNCVRHSWRFPAIFFCHSRRFLAILPHPFLPSRHPISRFI